MFSYTEHRSIYLPAGPVKHRMAKPVNSIAPVKTLLALVFGLAAADAFAQPPQKNDEVFRYGGADREARLLEGARREGSLTLYTSLAPTESKPLAEAFE